MLFSRIWTEYGEIQNAGKYGPEKLRVRALLMHLIIPHTFTLRYSYRF